MQYGSYLSIPDAELTNERSQVSASSRAIAGPFPLAISSNTVGSRSVKTASALRWTSSGPSAASSKSRRNASSEGGAELPSRQAAR